MNEPPIWNVALPEGAEPPFTVWVNGAAREEGTHYTVEGRWLRFRTPLVPKVKKRGLGRRMVLLAGVGVYDDQMTDVVDLRYHAGDRIRHATDLTVIAPEATEPESVEARGAGRANRLRNTGFRASLRVTMRCAPNPVFLAAR